MSKIDTEAIMDKESKLQESIVLLDKCKTRAYDLIRVKEITLEELKQTNAEIIRLEHLINDLQYKKGSEEEKES